MISRRKARILAFQALYAWDVCRDNLSQILGFAWFEPKKHTEEEDLLFSRVLVSGAVEHIEQIDGLIATHTKNWEIKRLNRVDLAILRMSVYALLYHTEVPPNVTIDEAIEIAREFGTDESYRFVNGILDSIRKATGVSE